jgi:hypothetical protein
MGGRVGGHGCTGPEYADLVEVSWQDPRCVVCLQTSVEGESMTVRSKAHVIPGSVGGQLWALCLCKRCNNKMGRMEALLARDISVRRIVKYQLQSISSAFTSAASRPSIRLISSAATRRGARRCRGPA